MTRSRSRSPPHYRASSRRRDEVSPVSGGRASSNAGLSGSGFQSWHSNRNHPYSSSSRRSFRLHSRPPPPPDDPHGKDALDGPMLSFKQFVLRNPDGSSQEVLNEGYRVYTEKYKQRQSELFFDRHFSLGFMQEAYNPNLLRMQFLLCRDRAQRQAKAFLQRWEAGGFLNLRLEAPVNLLTDAEADVSPLQLDEWQRQTRVVNPFAENAAERIETESEREFCEAAKDFLLLPDECCLGVSNVDPILTKFDILEALQSRGAVYVSMSASSDPSQPRFAHVFFETAQDAANAYAAGAEFVVTKISRSRATPTVGGSSSQRAEFPLRLQKPPKPPTSLRVALTPPIAATTQRREEDIRLAWQIVKTLDTQLEVYPPDTPHPLEEVVECASNQWHKLDLLLTYLRHVHCVCYYSGKVFDDPQQLQSEALCAHLRPKLSEAAKELMAQTHAEEEEREERDEQRSAGVSLGASPQQQMWVVNLGEKLDALLKMASSMKDSVPAALDEESNATIAAKWTAFCEEQTLKDSEGRFRCNLCGKLFKAPSYVHLHLKKKHEEELQAIVDKFVPHIMRAAYMSDPNKRVSASSSKSSHYHSREPDGFVGGSSFRQGSFAPPPVSRRLHTQPPSFLPSETAGPAVPFADRVYGRRRDWDAPTLPPVPIMTSRPTANYDDL